MALKNCPFCNGKSFLDSYPMATFEKNTIPENNGNWYYVTCEKCSAMSGNYLAREDAIESWNKRVQEE